MEYYTLQENYINYRPSLATKDDNDTKRMKLIARAAESIGDGDIVNVQIRRYRQWQLSQACTLASSIVPYVAYIWSGLWELLLINILLLVVSIFPFRLFQCFVVAWAKRNPWAGKMGLCHETIFFGELCHGYYCNISLRFQFCYLFLVMSFWTAF